MSACGREQPFESRFLVKNGVYSNPSIYDLAFSYRRYEDDSKYLLAWYKKITKLPTPPVNILELACGPGRVLLSLCSIGTVGVGLDINEEMCRYASELATDSSASVEFGNGDMTAFSLGQRFELVLTMLNSVNHINSDELLFRHFSCVKEHLSPSGVYIIETTRTEPLKRNSRSSWSASNNGDRIDISWCHKDDIEHAEITGAVGGNVISLRETFPMRYWSTDELVNTARVTGLTLAGCFGDLSGDPLTLDLPYEELRGDHCHLHQSLAFVHGSG